MLGPVRVAAGQHGRDAIVVTMIDTREAKYSPVSATDDDWTTSKICDVLRLDDDYPTTAVVREGTIFVVSTRLDALLHAAASGGDPAQLRAETSLCPIGSVEP
jgi:hypothetical protein